MLLTLARQHRMPPPPADEGVHITLGPFALIAFLVVAYVLYRVVQARRRGESGTAAAGRAVMEAAPPAIAAGIGIVFLYIAVALLFMALVVSMMFFVFTAPFAAMEAVFTGGEPDFTFGPFHELAAGMYVFLFLGLLLVLGALTWVAVAALRRAK